MNAKKSIIFAVLCLVLAACGSKSEEKGKGIECKYASLLDMQQHDGYITAEITNPWDTAKVLHRYVMVNRFEPMPSSLPEGTVVKVPLEKSVVFSAVHLSLLGEWNMLDAVKATYDTQYILIPEIHRRLVRGKIKDLGNSMQPDIEKLVDAMPDAILLSPYENSSSYAKIANTGIPVIECADYMEVSPLARAEWMKFYGILYGCTQTAASQFARIEKEYNGLKDSIASLKADRPTVFTDIKLGTQWMVPGGRSTVSILMHDAGAKYLFDNLPQSGSVTVSGEAVLDKCHDADYWLIKYNSAYDGYKASYDKLRELDPVYGQFAPMNTKKIFCCDTSVTGFYEETPFHPERLLKNLVGIFHPAKDSAEDMLYYKKLE